MLCCLESKTKKKITKSNENTDAALSVAAADHNSRFLQILHKFMGSQEALLFECNVARFYESSKPACSHRSAHFGYLVHY